MIDYLLLCAVAFGAATLLPFYSEILLVAQLRDGLDPLLLWLFATTGNTLGAGVNWWIGLRLGDYSERRWLTSRKADIARAQNWFNRYGKWSLLMTWLPIGGDALTVVGGLMKVPARTFFILVATGKGLRYAVLIMGYLAI